MAKTPEIKLVRTGILVQPLTTLQYQKWGDSFKSDSQGFLTHNKSVVV